MAPISSTERSIQPVLFVSADRDEGIRIKTLLQEAGYRGETLRGLPELYRRLSSGDCLAVIIDLDSLSVDNNTVRRLARRLPGICLFCSSRTPYHPELEQAISRDFFACLPRPVDPEELAYWLRCARENSGEAHAFSDRDKEGS